MTNIYILDNINFSFKDKLIINNLSLNFYKGLFYGIIGPNGAGKTTLLDILAGIKPINKGKVILFKRDIKTYNRKELAKLIALIPQEYHIEFDFTVEEILLMGRYPHLTRFQSLTDEDYYIINDTIKSLNLKPILHKYITELSGGEKQRVIFARALIQDTPILLVDEGTANLDIYYTIELMDILSKKVEKGDTVIATMHDMNLAVNYCDYLIFLKNGNLITQGETSKCLDSKIIKQVFNIESNIYIDNKTNRKCIYFFRGGRDE